MAAVAAAQAGLAHRRQLHALGIGRGAIAHRLEHGRLHRVLPSVFAIGHDALPPRGPFVAALLYAGDDCVLSHLAAAAVWALIERPPSRVAVTIVQRHIRQVGFVRVHRVPELPVDEVRLRDGLPVTSPARTLLDLAGEADDHMVEAALEKARIADAIRDGELERLIARHPLRPGARRITRVLRAEGDPALTRSEAERRFRRLLREAQLPAPEVNAPLLGFQIDFLWRAQRLCVEVDSHRFHRAARAFERDRRRDQLLVAAGYRVIRVTWRQFTQEPVALAVRIGQALVHGA